MNENRDELGMSIRRTVHELAVDVVALSVVSLVLARQLVRAATRAAYGAAVDVAGWAEKRAKR